MVSCMIADHHCQKVGMTNCRSTYVDAWIYPGIMVVNFTAKQKLLNKLDVGKQIRILNTTQNWVFSKAFGRTSQRLGDRVKQHLPRKLI